MSEKDFFFFYNYKLSAFLKYKGISYITKAINPQNNKMFTMYPKTDELQSAINEYKAAKQEG
ncbi:hypothetical protein BTO30_07125 [Domibacillus antri]|uniref:DUF5659 domain-containing protein n=1 Tax=Domibacillus antri TaxID=1714264 RepID=A0A1Q8Q6F1_9BACI|nr:hypothetical protein [Domibacillus antri]OLN22909.1 hypothetical protein BTO30_07125 [Domibacillus antri]